MLAGFGLPSPISPASATVPASSAEDTGLCDASSISPPSLPFRANADMKLFYMRLRAAGKAAKAALIAVARSACKYPHLSQFRHAP